LQANIGELDEFKSYTYQTLRRIGMNGGERSLPPFHGENRRSIPLGRAN
jgi:hypothetical protein